MITRLLKKFPKFIVKSIIIITIILLFYLILPKVESLLVASSYKLQLLFKTQRNLISNLKEHVSEVSGIKKRIVQKYITKCKTEHFKSSSNDFYLENPINAYTLIKRLGQDLDQIENILIDTKYERNVMLTYPSELDFEGATRAITHLIVVYELNITDIANGILTGNFSINNEVFTDYATPLSSTDCYELAKAAENFFEYEISLHWAKEAQKRYLKDEDDRLHIKLMDLENFISGVKSKIIRSTNEYKHVETLCYKEYIKNSRLACHYNYGPHPFLRLARLKVEPLHSNPDITLFHNVSSDKEIREIQKLAKIEMSIRKNPNDPNHRLTKIPILEEHRSRIATKISRRVLDMTGLYYTSADKLNVVNYGMAGYYAPHSDSVIYLSNVKLGGATMFPLLPFTMFPRKNSALFWTNLLPTGEVDSRTLHASCPVVHGSKWIMTKWISDPRILDTCHKDESRYTLGRPKLISKYEKDLSILSYHTVKHALLNL